MLTCNACHHEERFQGSRLCFLCLRDKQLVVDKESGEPIRSTSWQQEDVAAAHYRYRPVRCGNATCKTCPHYWYCYRTWRAGGRVRESYMGPADDKGDAHDTPSLRTALGSFGSRRKAPARPHKRKPQPTHLFDEEDDGDDYEG